MGVQQIFQHILHATDDVTENSRLWAHASVWHVTSSSKLQLHEHKTNHRETCGFVRTYGSRAYAGVAAFGGLSAAVGVSFGAVGAGLVGYKVPTMS